MPGDEPKKTVVKKNALGKKRGGNRSNEKQYPKGGGGKYRIWGTGGRTAGCGKNLHRFQKVDREKERKGGAGMSSRGTRSLRAKQRSKERREGGSEAERHRSGVTRPGPGEKRVIGGNAQRRE